MNTMKEEQNSAKSGGLEIMSMKKITLRHDAEN